MADLGSVVASSSPNVPGDRIARRIHETRLQFNLQLGICKEKDVPMLRRTFRQCMLEEYPGPRRKVFSKALGQAGRKIVVLVYDRVLLHHLLARDTLSAAEESLKEELAGRIARTAANDPGLFRDSDVYADLYYKLVRAKREKKNIIPV